MQTSTLLVLLNPSAGGGGAARKLPVVERLLQERRLEYRVRFTKPDLDASALVAQALQHNPQTGVIVIGGDGTLSHAVNGFFDPDGQLLAPSSWLGLIPAGSGSDFARTLGLPQPPEEALRSLLSVASRRIDVGKASYTTERGATKHQYFINIASFGMSGMTDRAVAQSPIHIGRFVHLAGAISAATHYTAQPIELRLDSGEWFRRTSLCTMIANGKYFGGGMRVAAGADPADGAFDFIDIADMSLLEKAKTMLAFYQDHPKPNGSVLRDRARIIEARPVNPKAMIPVDLDGESPGQLPMTVHILPQALCFRA